MNYKNSIQFTYCIYVNFALRIAQKFEEIFFQYSKTIAFFSKEVSVFWVVFFFFFCHFIFLTEGYLLYRILWFSVIHQQESAIGTPMSPPSQTSPPSPSPSHPSRLSQSPCLSFLSHTANSH